MIIFFSLIAGSIVIALILRYVVKTSRNSRYTSLGTLNSSATPKASIARKKKPLSTTETPPKKEISTSRETQVSRQNAGAADNAVLRQKLLLKAMGNVATVERLIEYERRLNPTATLTMWLKAAVVRWEDDHNGRHG